MSRNGRSGVGGPLPKRWLNCPRRGDVVADRFLPFKTPLGDEFNDLIGDVALQFPPSMILDKFKKIGLWINLTFTPRFYDKTEIEKKGITFKQLACRGHGETPTEAQTDEFIRIVKSFLDDHPDALIALHCTHGFNRTGFLISSYLCQIDSWEVGAAVQSFAKAHPPGIYKEDYLKKLFELYGDVEDCPSTPSLPEWCFDEEDGPDDEEAPKWNRPSHSKDFTNENPTFMEGVPGVTPITDKRELFRLRHIIKSYLGFKGTGFPGAYPVSMMCANMVYLSQKKYKVSWKADSVRYMMLIEGKDSIYFTDRDFSIFQVHGLTFPSTKHPGQHLSNTLVDGEMVLDEDPSKNGGKMPRYLIYDIIVYEQTDKIGLRDFDHRFEAIKKLLIDPRSKAMFEGQIDRNREPFGVRRKDFYDLSATEKVMAMKTGHEHDGLIFQPVPDPYTPGTCPYILKWKPSQLNTIDFKLKIVTLKQQGCLDKKIAQLYVTGREFPLAQIKITKENSKEMREYDGKIVECECLDLNTNQWKVMRIRTDKSHPNAFKTAQSIVKSIEDKLDEAKLLGFIRQLMYQQTNSHGNKRPRPSSDHYHASTRPVPPKFDA